MVYKFTPVLRPMVWGSELWVLSGYAERPTKVAGGEYDGLSVNELIALRKENLMGRRVYEKFGDEFPLLVKFIDARADLSIQVHPDEKLAQERHGAHGKTEMWYVIRTAPGAHLYSGLAAPLSPEKYVELVEKDRIVSVLADQKVAPGDVFFLPAGRIHAICGGTYLAEIQQTSDITYRIYDYGRPGMDGKPRELHTDLAKDAIDYRVYDSYRTAYTPAPDREVRLVECEHFNTSLLELTRSYEMDLSGLDTCLMVMCVGGEGTIDGHKAQAGEAFLVDAVQESLKLEPSDGGLKLLTSYV